MNGKEKIEFLKDGTLAMANRGIFISGRYEPVEKDRVKVEFGDLGAFAGPIIAKAEVRGNRLILTAIDGKVSKYKRFD